MRIHGLPTAPGSIGWFALRTDRVTRIVAARDLPLAVLVAACCFGLLLPGTASDAGPILFLVSAVFLGLPHGALDWATHARRERRRDASTLQTLQRFVPYLTAMLAGVMALVWIPEVTLLLFLGLAAWHFGTVDLAALAPGLDGSRSRCLALSRGALVVALPFVADASGAWRPFSTLASLVGTPSNLDAAATLAPLFSLLGAAAAVVLFVGLAGLARSGRMKEAGRLLAETAVAALLLLTAPPLFAVGIWFLAVHAFRHALLSPASGTPGTSTARRLVTLHRRALPLLLPGWLLLVAAIVFTGASGSYEAAALVIGFYAIVTFPHHVVTRSARA